MPVSAARKSKAPPGAHKPPPPLRLKERALGSRPSSFGYSAASPVDTLPPPTPPGRPDDVLRPQSIIKKSVSYGHSRSGHSDISRGTTPQHTTLRSESQRSPRLLGRKSSVSPRRRSGNSPSVNYSIMDPPRNDDSLLRYATTDIPLQSISSKGDSPNLNRSSTSPITGCLIINNMKGKMLRSTESLSGDQLIQRLKECVKQDMSAFLQCPLSNITIESIGGHPLTICLSIMFASGRDRSILVSRLNQLLDGRESSKGVFSCLCRAYSENSGVFISDAEIDFGTSWFVSQPPSDPNIGVGSRVKRNNLHWMWGDQDGGEGKVGTVIDCDITAGWVVVRWDANGDANKYRWGPISGGYDVLVVSHPSDTHFNQNSLNPHSPTAGGVLSKGISVGSKVRRNPTCWDQLKYGNPDGGDGGLGTVTHISGSGWTLTNDGIPKQQDAQHITVKWDHSPEAPPSHCVYRWGVSGMYDLIVVRDATRHTPTIAPTQPILNTQTQNEAVRCVQATVLSSRGIPPGASRVQIAFDGEPPEYTSIWNGDNPSWGETIALDVPPGVSTDLNGRMLRVVLLVADNPTSTMTPAGGCELELGHLVGPTSQTLWVALDPSMRSKLVASPTAAGRSLQTTASPAATCWLRISIGFVFVQLQQRLAEPIDTAPLPPNFVDSPIRDNNPPFSLPNIHYDPMVQNLSAFPPSMPVIASHHQGQKYIETVSQPVPNTQQLCRKRELRNASPIQLGVNKDSLSSANQAGSSFPSPLFLPAPELPAQSADYSAQKPKRLIMTPVRSFQDPPKPKFISQVSSAKLNSSFKKDAVSPPRPVKVSTETQTIEAITKNHNQPAPSPAVITAHAPETQQLTSEAPTPVRFAQAEKLLITPQRHVPDSHHQSLLIASPEKMVPAEGDSTSVVEYLVQLAFDPVTVLEVARILKNERVEDVGTLKLLNEDDLKSIGVPLGCRRRIANAIALTKRKI